MHSPSSNVDIGTAPAPVPFLDLSFVTEPIRVEVVAAFERLLDSGAFVNGREVVEFEEVFARYCGVAHCVGMASGLDALRIALLAAGLEPGDEVVVPANTFIATFEAVTQARGVPVVVDVGESDYCIDLGAVEAVLGPRTRFVIPVHLYGQAADVHALRVLADDHELVVVEDAAQAHGATRAGAKAGSIGHAAAFSFYPGKNLGALGDAGALTTDDHALATRARALREHGQEEKYRSVVEGYTARLDTIQAIGLIAKLRYLDEWNESRRSLAALYREQLDGVGDLVLPRVAEDSQPVWHLFVIRTADPVALGGALADAGIGSGRHYPEPPHLSAAYASLGHRAGSFPVTERVSEQGLTLPLFPGLTEEQALRVCATVRRYFDG